MWNDVKQVQMQLAIIPGIADKYDGQESNCKYSDDFETLGRPFVFEIGGARCHILRVKS
ncbi:MAG: hypothetical protein V7731_21100 [Amphritea sp.]